MTDARPAIADLLAGSFQVERELGRGGMGIVYLARDVRLDRAVAIKVLPPSLASQPALRERFLREARTAAQLSHPNIVPVFQADEVGGSAYFVMALVDGESLSERLRRLGALSPAETVRVLRETAWALAYAHARGVIHRDVKPENLMIERATGRVIVTDFGIARDVRTSRMTQDGLVLGSVHYMSPEQVAGETLDGRSDIYALGVVGFQCLTGQVPFDADQQTAVLVQHATKPAPPLNSVAPSVPAAVAAVIDRCLAKDPATRYPTGEALADALAAALEESSAAAHETSAAMLSEDEARSIWQRAAELQAEAATRIRERYQADPASRGDRPVSDGYRFRDVEAAAREAGIGPEFVALAVAERRDQRSVVAARASDREERQWSRMLGTEVRTLSAVAVIPATPPQVLAAIGEVFGQFPYGMALRDTIGGHPLDGGVLVFDVPRLSTGKMVGPQGISMFAYRMTQIDLAILNVTLRALPQGGTEVRCYGDLRPGLKKNWAADRGIAVGVGVVGAGLAGAAAAGALGLGLLAFGPALAGAAGCSALALACYRWVYRNALGQSVEELQGLLAALGGFLRSRSVFGSLPAGSTGEAAGRLPR